MIKELIAAREIIRKGWCQGSLALDKYGSEVDEDDAQACRWVHTTYL